ncbi:unnamed protein product [Menidia menidia]|uniref:(Atlantic silverside) hypothetical protein n=1 Tax=Menidia menidia TaxID=238744 RepID=A0A8S4B8R8_9TELE|nr:unnamed protein product [Menidia menidia]
MEAFRRTYLQLCEEGGVEPPEGVLAQLQAGRAAQGSRLDLSGQNLSEEMCRVLAKALQRDCVFTEVSLSDCMLSEEAAALLLTGLSENTAVRTLDLKGNNLRSKGAEGLGKLLASNRTLHRLVLEWNALGVWDEAFSLFCAGLASNSVLTQLDLRNNQISHHGASELCQALRRNSSLKELDLRWNNMGLLGGRSLLEALRTNRSLLQMEVAGNNIPSDTLRALDRSGLQPLEVELLLLCVLTLPEQTIGHNSDRQSTLRETSSRTQVLSREIQTLREEKGQQFLSLMETIDRQREEMGRSHRLQMTEAALALSEQKNQSMGELLSRARAETEEEKEQQSKLRKKEEENSALREEKLRREVQNLLENNGQLKNKV